LLSISALFWLMLMLGTAVTPEIDLISVIAGGVLFTFIPIGLGIYCVRRGRKSPVAVVPPVPVPPVSQRAWVPPCDYKNFLGVWCKETDDLAQCPECDGWFCKKHDRHECFPKKLDAQVQKQIDVARSRRRDARMFLVSALGGLTGFTYVVLQLWWGRALLVIYGAVILLLIIISLHYSRRIRQLAGVRKRSIRPQTAKEDR